MKLAKIISLTCAVGLTVGVNYAVRAEDTVTVAEVKAKVMAAAALLSKAKDKEATLKQFDGKDKNWGWWAWKNTYVFVFDCKNDKMMGHPTLKGQPILHLKDTKGTPFYAGDKGMCKASEQPGGVGQSMSGQTTMVKRDIKSLSR